MYCPKSPSGAKYSMHIVGSKAAIKRPKMPPSINEGATTPGCFRSCQSCPETKNENVKPCTQAIHTWKAHCTWAHMLALFWSIRACRHRHRQGHDRKTRFPGAGLPLCSREICEKKDLNRWKNWKIFHPKVSSVSWCETIQGTSRRAAPARPKWQALHAQDALGCRRSCLGTFIHAVSRNSQTTNSQLNLQLFSTEYVSVVSCNPYLTYSSYHSRENLFRQCPSWHRISGSYGPVPKVKSVLPVHEIDEVFPILSDCDVLGVLKQHNSTNCSSVFCKSKKHKQTAKRQKTLPLSIRLPHSYRPTPTFSSAPIPPAPRKITKSRGTDCPAFLVCRGKEVYVSLPGGCQ